LPTKNIYLSKDYSQMNKIKLSGKTAFITGATGAIGSAVAEMLAEEGVNLILLSSGNNQLNILIDKLSNHGVKMNGFVCDLSSLNNIQDLINNELKNEKIDILINSAGVFPNKSIHEMSIDDYKASLNINLNSAYLFCANLSKSMITNRWGRIVDIGSSSFYSGFRNTTAYCLTKHGLLGLSRSLHDELKEDGVRVYCISPSSTKGKMGSTTIGQDYSTFLDPDEVASYVLFAITHNGNAMSEEILIKRIVVR